ncbi:MAG: MFS transporter [Nitrospirae bacterium]|nr:MFS transporter [Nitrospirota bacterium]
MKSLRSVLAPGDVGAFFGLFLDNSSNLIVLSAILIHVYGFPTHSVTGMIPGTALGVLVGDLIYTWMAFRLAKREGRADVTAMPLGLDTPSTFGITFGAIGPFFLKMKGVMPLEQAAASAWHMAAGLMVWMGLFKLVTSLFGGWIRARVPRAGLLGSIAAVAILLIAFIPALDLFQSPIAGLAALVVILAALVAKIRMPWGVPGAVAAVAVGTVLYYLIQWITTGTAFPELHADVSFHFFEFMPSMGQGLRDAVPYLPIAIPFALTTVVGGIDVTESAAVAGDKYGTRSILLTEAFATLIAGLFGGVIQNTPYIGHPAYKSMGGKAGYTLAVAIAMGIGGCFGLLDVFVQVIPKVAITAILVFIGIEIMSQAFRASEPRHAPAVALCFVPVTATLVTIMLGMAFGSLGKSSADLTGEFVHTYTWLLLLGNGFVVSSMLWGSTLAFLIDGRARAAAACLLLLGGCSLFGIVHSPLESGSLFLPWTAPGSMPLVLAGAYAMAAILVLGIGQVAKNRI